MPIKPVRSSRRTCVAPTMPASSSRRSKPRLFAFRQELDQVFNLCLRLLAIGSFSGKSFDEHVSQHLRILVRRQQKCHRFVIDKNPLGRGSSI